MPTPSWSVPYKQFYYLVNSKKEAEFEYPLSNFGSFSYFQTSISVGVEQRLQRLPKFDINDLKLSFHCCILIPRKCPHKTPFKTQCPPPVPTALLNSPDANHNIFPLPQFLLINNQIDQFIRKVFILRNKRFFDFIQFWLKLCFQKVDFSFAKSFHVLMAKIL